MRPVAVASVIQLGGAASRELLDQARTLRIDAATRPHPRDLLDGCLSPEPSTELERRAHADGDGHPTTSGDRRPETGDRRPETGERRLDALVRGLIPSFTRDPKGGRTS